MKYILTILIILFGIQLSHATTIEMLNKNDAGERMIYSQEIANIDVGESITWVATSKGHNVEFVAGPEGATLPKKSKMNAEFTVSFDTPGIYYYVCTPHKSQGMIGLVVVGGDISNKDAIASAKALGKSKKKLADLISNL